MAREADVISPISDDDIKCKGCNRRARERFTWTRHGLHNTRDSLQVLSSDHPQIPIIVSK